MGSPGFLGKWAKLYSQPTDAERALEPFVAAVGLPYRFQHPIWALSVFPDFVWHHHKVAIEVDDASHSTKAKQKADALRTAKLNRAGWKVVRCTNKEAIDDPAGTVERLLKEAGLARPKD